MEKERIDLFYAEQKKLTDGKKLTYTGRVRRGGAAFFSTIALGVALFAVIFIICCFSGEFGTPAGAWRDTGNDGLNSPGTAAPGDSVNDAQSGDSTGNGGTSDTQDGKDNGFWAFWESLFGSNKNNNNPVVTTAPADTTTPETEPAAPTYPSTDALYDFNYSLVPPGEIAIVPKDMSLLSYGATYIYNDTTYAPKISVLAASKDSIPVFDYMNASVYPVGNPVVLIIHTHGTEAYSEEGSISYSESSGELARSTDVSKNVVAVGAVIAEVLGSNGIKTLHCTIMHDKESYKDSYLRSAETIKEYLTKYPSIQYVIDVHRDSLTTSSGALVRPVTLVDGKATAQVMCVVGSDYNGADYSSWQNNLSLALKLRSVLNQKYTNIARPVYLRSSAYNQQYAPMSMLLEVGASGNTLSEAKAAARITAQVLADIIKGKAG